jgi:predicted TIM-barrel fold metal-dependent hydrolase
MSLHDACGPAGCLPTRWSDASGFPAKALGDEEGARLPSSLPAVVDGHVHLFPDRVFEAIWRWFDTHGWPIRYKLPTPAVIDFLLSRGVEQVVALHYAHKPGMARALNAYMAGICASAPRVTGLATVFPGEEGALDILADAFNAGLRGVKLHCHVQAFAPDDERLEPLYRLCAERGMPLVMHAGREPSSKAYPVDPYTLCGAERVEAVLRSYPTLRLCVPHLGADEYAAYERLLSRHDNLWLDTTMAVAGYFPGPTPWRLLHARPERVLYGTDFPNLPYAWDREVKRLQAEAGLGEQALAQVLALTARQFFALPTPSAAAVQDTPSAHAPA